MNIYLVFKFDDYEKFKQSIRNFINDNPRDAIFYFDPEKSRTNQDWKEIAVNKIEQSDVVIYLRMRGNSGYSEEKMENVTFELQHGLRKEKSIIVYEMPVDEMNQEHTTPAIIYKKDYLDRNRIKYKVITELTMKEVKKALFDMENVLFQETSLSEKDQSEILLKEYQIMLETSEKMMDRRQGTNNFYITLCSAMLTAMVAFIAAKPSTMIWSAVSCAMSIMLLFLCYNWKKTLLAYGLSNQAKYEVLNVIEKKLPASIFTSEWQYGKMIDYSSYSKREIKIPDVFMILFGIISVVTLVICLLSIGGIIPAYLFQG